MREGGREGGRERKGVVLHTTITGVTNLWVGVEQAVLSGREVAMVRVKPCLQ